MSNKFSSKDVEFQEGLRYCFERSKSNGKNCTKCKMEIEQGSIRFGSSAKHSQDGSWNWRHFNCVTERQINNFEVLYDSFRKVPGYNFLKRTEKDSLISFFEEEGKKEEELAISSTKSNSKNNKTINEVNNVEKKTSDKKTKKVKDKNKPKGPSSAYFEFNASQRQQIIFTHPDYSFKDVAVELGARWKALSEQERIPFQKLADADRERYTKEMEVYNKKRKANGNVDRDDNDADESENERTVKKTKKVKDKNKPKGPSSSYFEFNASQRQQIIFTHPDYSFKDVAVELGARWKALSEQERIPFQKLADADRERYTKEMEVYNKKRKSNGNVESENSSENERTVKKTKKVKDKNAPKGVVTAYVLYCNTQRQQIKNEFPEYSFTDTASELGVRWKTLSEQDRIPFQKLADADKVRYTKEMEAYNKKKNSGDLYNNDTNSNDNSNDECDTNNNNSNKSFIIDKSSNNLPITIDAASVLSNMHKQTVNEQTPYNMSTDAINF